MRIKEKWEILGGIILFVPLLGTLSVAILILLCIETLGGKYNRINENDEMLT